MTNKLVELNGSFYRLLDQLGPNRFRVEPQFGGKSLELEILDHSSWKLQSLTGSDNAMKQLTINVTWNDEVRISFTPSDIQKMDQQYEYEMYYPEWEFQDIAKDIGIPVEDMVLGLRVYNIENVDLYIWNNHENVFDGQLYRWDTELSDWFPAQLIEKLQEEIEILSPKE